MKLDELLEAGVPLEEAEMQALELMREALAGGMNMGGRVGFSEGSGPDMDRVLELEEQGFSYEEAFEKAMQERLDRGYAAGGAVESMDFLKQHLPYQDGGHVALRRKMFKLGGPVNTHGVGITSGLEYRNNYNAGGSVQQAPVIKPGPDGRLRQHGILGGMFGTAATVGTAGINQLLRLMANKNARKYGTKVVDEIAGKTKDIAKRYSTKDGSKLTSLGQKKIDDLMKSYKPLSTLGKAGQLAKYGTAPALAAYGVKTSLDDKDPENRFEQATDFLGKSTLDFSIPGALSVAEDYLSTPLDEEFGYNDIRGLSSRLAGIEGGSDPSVLDKTGESSKTGMTLDQLKEQNAAENQARMQQAMEQYAELLAGSDDTNKLATLGDALIAGGSALMEGEGYGAAGRAFNEPLSGARRSKEERMSSVNQAAAQLAISENMQIDAENRAVVNEFMKTGSFTDAEQAQLMALAQQTGGARLIPEKDGEIDEDVVKQPGVYADPKNLSGKGSLFIAIDSSGIPIYTNDPQEAKAHAAS